MDHRQTWTTVVSIGLMLLVSTSTFAQTRLGLHITQEELTIWQQRAASGPYKTAGDVSTNSPGDWTRIKANADALLPSALAENWTGQTTAACWNPFTGVPVTPGPNRGQTVLNAGFAYVVLGTTTYRDAVRTALLDQAGRTGTNFADATRWCTTVPPSGNGIGDGYSWEIANWLTRLVFAYDYIRSSLSGGDQTTLDLWFFNAATFWATAPDIVIKTRFPNRNTDNYTPSGGWPSTINSITHYNCDTSSIGNQTYDFHEAWSNRGATQIRFAAAAGILTNNTYAKNQAQRWFKEWLQYATFPDNMINDYKRWDDYTPNSPTQGWSYAGLAIGAMASVADMFARNGDLSLYNYSTANGLHGTAGGTKTLQSVMLKHSQFVTRTYNWIGEANGTFCGNVNYLLQSVDLPGANNGTYGQQNRNSEAHYLQANLFYQNATIKTIYLRTAAGAPAYPVTPTMGGWTPWTGEWGVYPGPLFMFGNMEGVVAPYGAPGGLICQ